MGGARKRSAIADCECESSGAGTESKKGTLDLSISEMRNLEKILYRRWLLLTEEMLRWQP